MNENKDAELYKTNFTSKNLIQREKIKFKQSEETMSVN